MNKSNMYKALVLFFLTFIFLATSRAAEFNRKTSRVLYADTLVLTKEMFKGSPLSNRYEICTSFYFDYRIEQDFVIMNVYSLMDKNNSSPAKECRFETWVLRHELYHFKIAEIWARVFSANLSNKFADKKIKKDKIFKYIDKQYAAHFEDSDSMQDLYDLETNHSKNKDKQKEWEAKIDKMLEEYKDYANKEIVIKLK